MANRRKHPNYYLLNYKRKCGADVAIKGIYFLAQRRSSAVAFVGRSGKAAAIQKEKHVLFTSASLTALQTQDLCGRKCPVSPVCSLVSDYQTVQVFRHTLGLGSHFNNKYVIRNSVIEVR